jgi:hypothetical protein
VSGAALVLLALVAAGGLVLSGLGERRRASWGAVALVTLLAVAAVLAWTGAAPSRGVREGVALAALLAAVTGGGPVATAVLRAADPTSAGVQGGPGDPDVLRGGAWIGVLERAAVAGSLLADWPEGLAVVLAVKGLGRYNELRTTPAASERFILGTLASALWAAACVGVAVLTRG